MDIDYREGCPNCPCVVDRLAPCQRVKGKNKVAIVVDHPATMDQAKRTLLNGDSGLIAKKVLTGYGLKPSDCYITSALNCRPNVKKEALMKNAMLACKDRLLMELEDAGVEKVLCL